jgi:hypothetical protein
MHITNFKPEEFLKISHEPYLNYRKSTNLLNFMLHDDFTRASICKSFVNCLKVNGKKSLPTRFHLNWAMECLGFSFSLPLDDSSLISSALSIYKEWFSQGPGCPEVLSSKLSYYQKEIIGHVSLAFMRRENTSKHERVCREILDFFKFIMKLELLPEIWDSLLLVLIILTDQVLTHNGKLAEIICSSLIKVLLEALLRARTKNKDLWTLLKKKVSVWIDFKPVIEHWASVTLSLTKTVCSIVYGEDFNDIEVVFDPASNQSEVLRVALDDQEKVYFWFRFMELVVVETKSSAKMKPEIHGLLAGAVSSIIFQFLSVCLRRVECKPLSLFLTGQNNGNENFQRLVNEFKTSHDHYSKGICRLPMPSINGLMDLFGSWLFYHSQVDPAYDINGKSATLSVLCKIFSFAQGPATTAYSITFFTTLLSNICDGDRFVVGEILKNSTEIVTYGIEAVDFLMRPDGFIQHLALYLCDKETEKSLRFPCLSILSSISVIPNVFKIRQISKNIVDIFVSCLSIESKNSNFHILVWSMCAFASTLKDDQDSVQRIVCAMIDKLEKVEYKEKDKEKFSDLIEVITILPYLINKKLVAPQIVKRNVEKLQSLVPKRGKSVDDFQTTSVLFALSSWVECFPVSMMNSELRFEFIKSLENRKKYYKNSVLFIEGNLINTLTPRLRNETGCNLSKVIKNPQEHLQKHFLFNKTVLSLTENHGESGISMKNAFGTFCWKVKMPSKPAGAKKSFKIDLISNEVEKRQKSSQKKEEIIDQDLPASYSLQMEKFKTLYCTQKNRILYSKNNEKTMKKPAENIGKKNQSFNRMLFSQMGLLDMESWKSLQPIPDVHDQLVKNLDAMGEKETIIFPILYIETPEDKESSLFEKNRKYSQSFQDFLQNLGMKLDNSTNFQHFHHFFQDFEQVIYKNFKLFESFTYFPEFLIKKNVTSLKDFLENHSVCVIWNQKLNDVHSKKKPGIFSSIELETTTVLTLNVINSNLTRVSIEGKQKLKGPLLSQMIVPNSVLPRLLAFTIYNYQSEGRSKEELFLKKANLLKDQEKSTESSLSSLSQYLLF